MKRFIAFLLILVIVFSCVGCTEHDCEKDYRDRSAERYIKSVGFESIEKLSEFGDYRTYLTYDTRTNVEYIVTFGNGSNGFCPYYGKDGNVIIYGGK
jgi:hypothetical protein